MKKVSDLRVKYYEEVTLKRKEEQRIGLKAQETETKTKKQKEFYLKYKNMFERIVSSERMKIKLNKRIYKWVSLFIKNMKKSIKKESFSSHR